MKKFTEFDTEKNAAVYKNFLEMGIDDGWTSGDKMANFEQFLRICEYTHFPISQSSVLDAGCGTGDFAYFLQKHEVLQYVGIDIYEPAVDKARMKYPFAEFIVGDFLTHSFPTYDFVYASGSVTAQLDTDNYQVLESWIKKMWKISTKGIVFNVLLERYPGEETDEHLFLYNRQKVLEMTAKALPKAQMKILVDDAGCGDGTEELHVYLYR